MKMTLLEKIKETQLFLQSKGITSPEFGLILGSGLGELAEEIENPIVVDYAEIPNWGKSTVMGHAGKLIYGQLSGRSVLALQGRFHFYEGNPMEVVTFPVRVMKSLGCHSLMVTNAAGGIGFGPGTLMLINDHINMTGTNPLIGDNLYDFGPRFPDMSNAYNEDYRKTAHSVADNLSISLKDGVYLGCSGPTYETPAEIRAFKTLGADAVGMSTVPEVIVAVHSGLKVLGISAITNHAAGFQSELNHAEVVAVTEQIKEDFKGLVKAILAEL
ncbi:purine nucleoside phosphorylase I, inosine and guanosine-specific [Streptococcus urinalis 2285-97]|uniref:Purine nucleoside phosphorylase n=2 Tax=Streptococcus urinalis TaxID=149016 RepID=G5KGL5_9STRE|nr:purine nucleoside phosphorylase I, inosine and guanosine-specific [Streptococcus urinalis 2285-97]